MLIPIIAFGFYVFAELIALAWGSQISILEQTSAIGGVAITVSSGLYVILFHIPLPVKKNAQGIRWGFLYRLSPHPSDREKFDRWLDK